MIKFITKDKIEGQLNLPDEEELKREKLALNAFWAKIVADNKPQKAQREQFIES